MRSAAIAIAVIAAGCGQEKQPVREEMPLKTFVATRDARALEFNAEVQLSSYFGVEYMGCEDTHYSVAVRACNPSETVYAYVPRSTELGRKVYSRLKDGKPKDATVKIQCTRGSWMHVDLLDAR